VVNLLNNQNFMRKLITTLLCSVMLLCNAAYGFSQNYDVRTKSDITAEQLDAKLQNRLKGTGCYFIAAQEEYGVNAEFLAAIAIHESGNGSSTAARRKNNFFGLMGSKGQLSFETPRECIMTAAKNISKPNGYYFARGNYTINRIGRRWAADKKWSTRIVATMKGIR
jgi:beta-N-acetylglucosaminidase